MGDQLTYNEFFVTLQGEGPSIGTPAFFLRMHGCHRQCVWCDTAFTWDGSEKGKRIDVVDLCREVQESPARILVLTGGEPLLHDKNEKLREVLRAVRAQGKAVEVETAGDHMPSVEFAKLVDRWNLSPKLPHACGDKDTPISMAALRAWALTSMAERTVLKFVVRGADPAQLEEDLAFVDGVVDATDFARSSVWLMPEGQTLDEQLRSTQAVFDAAVRAGYNATPRAHILAWRDERGR